MTEDDNHRLLLRSMFAFWLCMMLAPLDPDGACKMREAIPLDECDL